MYHPIETVLSYGNAAHDEDPEERSIDADLAPIKRIGSAPLILRILCDATGLCFAAPGRVSGSTWTACAVLDRVGFGVHAGHQLGRANELAALRDRSVAVLGHDLRDPVAAYAGGLELLGRHKPRWGGPDQGGPGQDGPGQGGDRSGDQKVGMITQRMKSSVRRMTELVDNVLAFARGQLGDGIPIIVRPCEGLSEQSLEVVGELQSIHPWRVIVIDFRLRVPVECDGARIAQVLSNLLANALTHGDPAQPARVAGG
nr:histidine kinase dimerization/phospho-acceptor domain-containing protein [uncultured Lichenicoccus sp.]